MTFVWLLIWLIFGADHISYNDPDGWSISLAICAFLDLTGRAR